MCNRLNCIIYLEPVIQHSVLKSSDSLHLYSSDIDSLKEKDWE